MKKTRIALLALAVPVVGLAGLMTVGVSATSHPTQKSALGTPISSDRLVELLATPGPVEVETVVACDWEVERSGLINLSHPAAQAAKLEDGPEPIQIFTHALKHPTQGLFLVDTGVEEKLRDRPDEALVTGIVAKAVHTEKMKFQHPLGEWLRAQGQPLKGVFFTHLHFDHITGLPDVPKGTPLYTGPGEAGGRQAMNVATRGLTDRALEGHAPLSEWAFETDTGGRFEGVLDVFGDGTVFALYVPGHTPGSTAYLARTPNGPVLLTGDTSHTRWGWEHAVEPGSFTADQPRNAKSLKQLLALAKLVPGLDVRFGHQR